MTAEKDRKLERNKKDLEKQVKEVELKIGDLFVKEEQGPMPYSTKHLRLPITAKGRSIYDVKAEIIGGSKEIIPSNSKILFWEREFAPHNNHDTLVTPKDVAEHMMNFHYKFAGPVNIRKGETKNVNLIVKVDRYENAQIPNMIGEERKLKGVYEIEVMISAKDIKPQTKKVYFTIDDKVLAPI